MHNVMERERCVCVCVCVMSARDGVDYVAASYPSADDHLQMIGPPCGMK